VYTGLLDRTKSTGELAGVLGHELVHIKDHHMARMSGPDPISLLGLLAVLAARGSAAGQAAGVLSQALSATRQFSYSRQLEMEADTLGVRYMSQAGYDPKSSLSFLKTLDQQRILSPTDLPPYLLTHPLTQERVANVELIIRSLNSERPRSVGADPVKRIQVILRLERHEADQVLQEYEMLVGRDPKNAESRHLLAVAQHHQGRLSQARENYETARALDPGRPGLDRDLGRLYTQSGEFKLAHQAFDRALSTEPREPLNYLYSGELFEKESNMREAANAYFQAHNLSPLWPLPPHRLGIAYGKMNSLADAYYYLGRSELLQDEDERAIANYERALKALGPSSLRAQVVKEELETIKSRKK
jgi:predicted Zn-dependent protease